MDLQARVGASAVLALLLLSGCAEPDAEPRGALTVAPGTTAHLLLNLDATGGAGDVELSVHDADGLNVTLPELHGNATAVVGWLGIQAPADAEPGEHEVFLDVRGAEARRVSVTVTVASPDDPLGQGAVALVDLTIRTRDGTVGATNREDVAGSPLPRSDGYQPPQTTEPHPLLLSPQQLPPEIVGRLASAAVGQSLTIEMPDFYGPVTQEQEVPRNESVPRTQPVQRYVEMPRAQAEQQGLVTAETREGDALETGGPLPYVVETLDAQTLRAEVDLREGDRVTLHPDWPNATVVEERGAEALTLRTDPPAEGERFTWNPDWPDATEVAALDGETITLRHSPAEGSTYTSTGGQGPPAQTTVVAVGPETITLSHANPHPLAGRTVFMELTVVDEEDAPQQPAPGGAPPGP